MEAELLLWGGSGVTDGRVTWLSDLWRFDMRQRLWTESNADQKPEARYTPVFEAVDGEVFLFSGYTQRDGAGVVLDDSWLLRDSEWTRVRAANRPSARYGTTSARGERGVAVFGGFDGTRDLADLWLFDLCARDWINLAPASPDGPSPRYCAAAAVYGRRLALFGGRSRAHPKRNYNDLWVFDLELAKWELVEANREPHVYGTEASYPGYHAKSAVAVLDRAMYLWGGEGRDGHVSDLWRLDLRDLTWQQLAGARSDDPKLW
jgi:hypothetical protein